MFGPFEEKSNKEKIHDLDVEIKETELKCVEMDLTLKTIAVESAQLDLIRDKLYHNKLLEIAGYDEE